MSIQTACIFLAILTACSLQWPLFFLPIGAAIPLMITAGAIGFLGILAAVKGLLCFKILNLIGTTLLQIPVFVVFGYTSSALASYDNQCNRCRFPVYYPLGNGYCTDYVTSLCNKTTGFLWSGLIVACISCIFTGISLVGFCKLRIHHQMGATRVVQTDGHHHPQPIVFTPAQPTVYTVPTTTYVTGGVVQQQGAIYVQQQTGVYPQMPPPAYTAEVQQVNHNPPYNPTF